MISLRSSVMVVAIFVAGLEIIFLISSLLGYFRPLMTADVEFLFMVVLVATTSESWAPVDLDFDRGFERLPGLYQFYLACSVFVLMTKAGYFIGFFVGLVKGCLPESSS